MTTHDKQVTRWARLHAIECGRGVKPEDQRYATVLMFGRHWPLEPGLRHRVDFKKRRVLPVVGDVADRLLERA